MKSFSILKIDLVILVIANLINLLLAALFWCRKKNLEKLEYKLGLILLAMLPPILWCWSFNLTVGRPPWTYILLIPVSLFLTAELIFDYLLKLNFRDSVWHRPYLFAYYSGLIGLVIYSFFVVKMWGFVTLATYLINLLATWYAHRK